MTRIGNRLRNVFTGALLLAAIAVSASPQSSADAPEAMAPSPDLQGLEPLVAEQIRAMQDRLEALSKQSLTPEQMAESQADLAKLYHAYSLHDAAAHHYRRAIELAPDKPKWRYLLGRLLQVQGRLEQAGQAYGKALTLAPDSVLARLRRGDVNLLLNRIEAAKSDYLQAFYRQPHGNVLIARLGKTALAENDPDLALQYLLPALKNQPEANRLHYLIGQAYRDLGDFSKARQHLGQRGPVGLEPPDPHMAEVEALLRGERLHLLQGKLAFQAGRYREATAAFGKAVEEKPDSVRALINLGTTLDLTGRPTEAEQAFRRALALEPKQATANYNLGLMALRSGRAEEAAQRLGRAIAARPKDAAAHAALARAYREAGDTPRALDHFRRAARLDPSQISAWLDGAQLLLDTKRVADALRVLEQASGKHPAHEAITLALAHVLAASPDPTLRNGPRARELLRTESGKRRNIRWTEVLAMALAEMGRCEQAAEQLRQVLGDSKLPLTDNPRERLRRQLEHYIKRTPCRPGIQ